MTAPGLRERKKSETKTALSRAALALATAHGTDRVTAEMIAAAANVSVRTFHNYFGSKEDALLFVLEQTQRGLIESFADRDPTEPVLVSFEALFVDMVQTTDDFERIVQVTRLMAEQPTLTVRFAAVNSTASHALLAEIGRRTGTDPGSDLYPRLALQCASAVFRAAADVRLGTAESGSPERESLVTAIRDGFAQLRHGLPQPVR